MMQKREKGCRKGKNDAEKGKMMHKTGKKDAQKGKMKQKREK